MSAIGTKRTCIHVRFEGNNGHDPDVTRCLLLTQSGLSGSAQAREALATFAGEDDNLARVEMEWLGIEFGGESLDLLLVYPQSPGTECLPHGEVFEIPFTHFALASLICIGRMPSKSCRFSQSTCALTSSRRRFSRCSEGSVSAICRATACRSWVRLNPSAERNLAVWQMPQRFLKI